MYATPRTAMPSFKAGGPIYKCRFLELSTSADWTVTQANAGAADILFGVSGDYDKYPPSTPGATAGLHAETGDTVAVIFPGEIAILELGSGGATRGVGLIPDSDGKGVAVGATAGSTFYAQALEAGSAGDYIRVLVLPRNQLNVA